MAYFDVNLDLGPEEKAIREAAHKFAKEIMRPISKEMDRMTATEAVAEGSPLWGFIEQAFALGYHKAAFPEIVGGLGFTPLQSHILMEELFWGSPGLGGVLLLAAWPYVKLMATSTS